MSLLNLYICIIYYNLYKKIFISDLYDFKRLNSIYFSSY